MRGEARRFCACAPVRLLWIDASIALHNLTSRDRVGFAQPIKWLE